MEARFFWSQGKDKDVDWIGSVASRQWSPKIIFCQFHLLRNDVLDKIWLNFDKTLKLFKFMLLSWLATEGFYDEHEPIWVVNDFGIKFGCREAAEKYIGKHGSGVRNNKGDRISSSGGSK